MSALSQFRSGTGYPLSTTGIGYGTGSGGSVTQAISTAAVTLNKMTGEIVTVGGYWNTGTTLTFLLNNNLIQAKDTVLVSLTDTTGNASSRYFLCNAVVTGAGQCYMNLYCTNGVSNSSLKLYFSIIKGATA